MAKGQAEAQATQCCNAIINKLLNCGSHSGGGGCCGSYKEEAPEIRQEILLDEPLLGYPSLVKIR